MTEYYLLNVSLLIAGILITFGGALHALFGKREARSAFAWVAVCLMWPVVGTLVYLVFGKNRIKTRARRLHKNIIMETVSEQQATHIPVQLDARYSSLSRLSGAVSGRVLSENNQIEPLFNGINAFPAMLEAIDAAEHSVYLCTYIFSRHGVGREFIQALRRAHARGVEIRVLIDGVGEKYSFPTARAKLEKLGITVARYLPVGVFPPRLSLNLRNHRKIIVVDGRIAFAGGMNIRQRHIGRAGREASIRDIHFRLQGPIVGQLQQVFVKDWHFSSSEAITPPSVSQLSGGGDALCRVIEDGPNEDVDKLIRIMIDAVSSAREKVSIMTPYFLPPRELELALQTAAMRGVLVEIVLPAENNLPFVQWATYHMLDELLVSGVRCYLSPGVFTHSKLFMVDDYYVQLGSANLDARSLKLNFELAVEVYDRDLGGRMADHFLQVKEAAAVLDQSTLPNRNIFARLRNALFWLMSPYM
ncbi:MAG: cardiolipin synthase [Pseudomonadales bacterium]